MCPKNYLFCIPTNFLPQLFNIFTQIYLPYLWHYATLNMMRIFVNSKDNLTISLIIMITTMILILIISSVVASVVTSPQVNASENLMRWPFPLPSSSLSSTSSSSPIVKVKVKIRWIASVNVMRQPLERNARGFYCSRNHFLERKRFFIQEISS